MRDSRLIFDLTSFKKIYPGIYGSLLRAAHLFDSKLYFNVRKVASITGTNYLTEITAIHILVCYKDTATWAHLVNFLTQKEHFFQSKSDPHQFFRRGSSVILTPAREREETDSDMYIIV